MQYKVTVTTRHKDIPRGREAIAEIDEAYQGGYKVHFENADTKDFDGQTFSWDYINKNKDYFKIEEVDNG